MPAELTVRHCSCGASSSLRVDPAEDQANTILVQKWFSKNKIPTREQLRQKLTEWLGVKAEVAHYADAMLQEGNRTYGELLALNLQELRKLDFSIPDTKMYLNKSSYRPEWLTLEGTKQMDVKPSKWGISFDQLERVVEACCETPLYQQLKAKDDPRSPAGTVNMYQFSEHFLCKWTFDTGSSVALLCNENDPKGAEAMLSHVRNNC